LAYKSRADVGAEGGFTSWLQAALSVDNGGKRNNGCGKGEQLHGDNLGGDGCV